MGNAPAHSSMGFNAITSNTSKLPAAEGIPAHQSQHGAAVLAKVSMISPDSVCEPTSLQLESRELSAEPGMKSEEPTAGASPKSRSSNAQPGSTLTPFPRADRTVSWADVDDSDDEVDGSFGMFSSPTRALIPSFSGEAAALLEDGADIQGCSPEDSPAPLAPAVMPGLAIDVSDGPCEPVQTHFGFNLLPLGAVPEDAEMETGASVAEEAADPNNRVSVVISGGDDDDPAECRHTTVTPRQHGYAGVLSMLHRSVSADGADLAPATNLAVTSARIETVLPVGQHERVRFADM